MNKQSHSVQRRVGLKLLLHYDMILLKLGHIAGQNFPQKSHMHRYVHRSAIHHTQDMEKT